MVYILMQRTVTTHKWNFSGAMLIKYDQITDENYLKWWSWSIPIPVNSLAENRRLWRVCLSPRTRWWQWDLLFHLGSSIVADSGALWFAGHFLAATSRESTSCRSEGTIQSQYYVTFQTRLLMVVVDQSSTQWAATDNCNSVLLSNFSFW